MTSTPEQVIANIREAVYASKDMPLNSADRLRVTVDDPSLFSDYISEDAEWAIESLEALLSALEAAEAERDALRKALEPIAPIAKAILSEAPADSSYFSVFLDCEGNSHRVLLEDLRTISTLAGENHE